MSDYAYAFQNQTPYSAFPPQNQHQHLPNTPNHATAWDAPHVAYFQPVHQSRHISNPSTSSVASVTSPPPMTAQLRPTSHASSQPSAQSQPSSTLLWTDLEIWMDAEYVKTPSHSAPTITHSNASGDQVMTMPNSSRPFVLNWAPTGIVAAISAPPLGSSAANINGSMVSTTPATSHSSAAPVSGFTYNGPSSPVAEAAAPGVSPNQQQQPPQYPREYSIFVGDLAPETSNSDLVAVFRNPVLGLRNDRAPKFIRPFVSCKSAKIMLDPVTGVSRGYGFVRFTDESDQQRALIEMHGLYCLSRPMRISPATAKFKPPPGPTPDFATIQPSPSTTSNTTSSSSMTSFTSVSSIPTSVSASSDGNLLSPQSHTPGVSTSGYYQPPLSSLDSYGGGPSNGHSEEWKHHAQARAILGHMIGPNGEQLTSTDPYNTTVFVGGLSPLIQEDTLKSFFMPFGEIHYVKVPVGKHCGFVQFVRKADAERAIEKMQGYHIGGSRIRLSWGRSQYKAAQAAAQAAQSAALQASSTPTQVPNLQPISTPQPLAPSVTASLASNSNVNGSNGPNGMTPAMLNGLTHEQAILLLQKFGIQGLPSNGQSGNGGDVYQNANQQQPAYTDESLKMRRDDGSLAFGYPPRSSYEITSANGGGTFSPFSPDPNRAQQQGTTLAADLLGKRRDSYAGSTGYSGMGGLSSQSFGGPSFFQPPHGNGRASGSPTGAYGGGGFAGSPPAYNRYSGQQQPISRPTSGPPARERSEDFDAMHDLNGTLASLNLDRERELDVPDRSWSLKSPLMENASTSGDSASSGGSVQFRLTMGRTPSP
ncbi:unnamed protein product [Mycena citricolor]|uniref:RRM domain-containing protein n=1 Tax=Mycena citricolor TaxID=2018698 RepID=A0AAD2JZY5_9AGAR|nr:unnamed protein product [Mycena citricolor]